MSELILLDSGPLGIISKPKPVTNSRCMLRVQEPSGRDNIIGSRLELKRDMKYAAASFPRAIRAATRGNQF